MAGPTITYVGLGSNLGNRDAYLQQSLHYLEGLEGVRLLQVSPVIETQALGAHDQPPYLNAVAEVETTLEITDFYQGLVRIENVLGRKRSQRWSSRTIDLDLLIFGDQVIDTPDLKVPHPRMHLRSFVLHGLAHLNPAWTHPVMNVTVVELKDRLNGGDFYIDPNRVQLVCIAGNIGVGKTTLAEQLGLGLGAEVLYEPYDTNPFMPEVYAGKQELALDSELYFLTNRVAQLTPDRLQGDRLYVADYLFDNDMMYARRLLDDRQMALYRAIYGPLCAHVLKPVLVIYLTDQVERCLDRIHTRNRAYEQGIQVPFLQDLEADYQAIFERWKTCPVMRLDMGRFDCLDREAMEALCRQVRYYIHDKVFTKETSHGDHRNH